MRHRHQIVMQKYLTICNGLQSLLSASYLVEYFSYKCDTITPVNVRYYYGKLFFNDVNDKHPESRGSYCLAKEKTDDCGCYDIDSNWILLFRTWRGGDENEVHKSFSKFL